MAIVNWAGVGRRTSPTSINFFFLIRTQSLPAKKAQGPKKFIRRNDSKNKEILKASKDGRIPQLMFMSLG